MLLEIEVSSLLSKISFEENQENKKELDKKYKIKLKELQELKEK